jgi:hypothetical protein
MFIPFDGVSIAITPAVDTAIYASGDLLFAPTKLQDATQNTKGLAILRTLVLLDSDNQKPAMDLLFFDSDPGSLGALNAALDMPAAALAKLIAILNVATGDWTTLKTSTNAIGIKTPTLMLPAAQKSKDFWVAGVSRGTPTYTAATSLTMKAILERQG